MQQQKAIDKKYKKMLKMITYLNVWKQIEM